MSHLYARISALLTVAVVSLATAQTPTQNPTPTPPSPTPAQAPRAFPKPSNIKVLKKDITGTEIHALMGEYEGDLGVGCNFCHAQNPTTKRSDFASDANPMKDTARYMITMTAELNDKWLADMPGRMYADPITCGTCHRGEKHPSVFVPTPRPRPAAAATTQPSATAAPPR